MQTSRRAERRREFASEASPQRHEREIGAVHVDPHEYRRFADGFESPHSLVDLEHELFRFHAWLDVTRIGL